MMKKVLLSGAAICGLALAASPAHAQVELELGGYFKGYGAFVDHDEPGETKSNDFDFIRDTEIHFTGETTLDNGLTVGFHAEAEVDNNTDDNFIVDESYAYFAGSWGRVNFGAEDGVAYLLQVAAPSADSNIDGIRQYVSPVNMAVLTDPAGAGTSGISGDFQLDYDQNTTGKDDKLTYMTPIFNGFQAGVSFTPDAGPADDLSGIGTDDVAGAAGAGYEGSLRYEGQFDEVGVIVGAGYTHVELEATNTLAAGVRTDDRQVWNVGVDLDIGAFGLGAVYKEDNVWDTQNAANTGEIDEEQVFVVGGDYTTGPFKVGLSYYDSENTNGNDGLESQRYSGGVTYTYGPGMTFNGSIGYVDYEGLPGLPTTDDDKDATYVTLGTQINF